jgi:hypothetical protein
MASNFLHNEALITRVIVTESSYLVRTKRPQYGTIQAERRGHGTLLQRVIGEPSYKFRALFFKQSDSDISFTLLNEETKRHMPADSTNRRNAKTQVNYY